MAHRMRRALIVGGSAAAALMVTSSAAFACTNFLGRITAGYNGSGALTTTTTADGYKAKGGMLFCPVTLQNGTVTGDGDRLYLDTLTNGYAVGKSSGGDTVTVTVQPNTCVGAHQSFTTQIGAANNYHIYGMHGVWDDANGTTSQDCMGTSSGATDLGGPFNVTSSTSPQSFTSNAWTPGPGGGTGSAGYTVVCFDVSATQAVDSAPEVNTNMVA